MGDKALKKAIKAIEELEANPAGDWRIEDYTRVADRVGLTYSPPRRGSHYTFKSPHTDRIATVPFRRPIKPHYVKGFAILCRQHLKGEEGKADER